MANSGWRPALSKGREKAAWLTSGITRRLRTFRRSCKVLGKRFAIRMYLANALWPAGHAYDENFDEEWSVSTSGAFPFNENELPSEYLDFADGYEGTRVGVVRHAMGLVPVDRDRTEFWDLGSGKGKVAFIAADEGYRKIVGIELSQDLHDEAIVNLDTVKKRVPDADIDLRCESATDVELPDGPLVVFMFNPFRGEIFAKVLTLLEERAQRSDAELWIIYVHPIEHDRLLESPHFDIVAEETVTPFWWSSFIYRSKSGVPAADRAMSSETAA